jgi:hypothetical protein
LLLLSTNFVSNKKIIIQREICIAIVEIQVQSMDQGGKEKIPSFRSVMFLNE